MEIGWGLYFQVLPSHSQLAPQPLAPTEVVGTPKHSITYPYPPLAIGSEGGARGARGSKMGVRGSKGSEMGVRGSEGSKQVARWLAPPRSPHSLSLTNEPPGETFTT